MTIGLSDDAYVADTPSFAIFFLLKCGTEEQWVRFWSGQGLFELPADATDTTGGTYAGVGALLGLPELSGAFNGAYSALDFSLSGFPPEAVAAALEAADLVEWSRLHVGMVDLDHHQAPVGACDWMFRARAGRPAIKRTGQGLRRVRTISLPALTSFGDTRLTASRYLTPTGQRARSADDAFCDLTPAYSSNSTVKWPA